MRLIAPGCGEPFGHVRGEVAGAERIHAHAAAAPLGGEVAGEADHSCLRGGVARHRRVAGRDEAEDRGHVHDRAAALGEHGPPRQLREHHHGEQVDLDQVAQLAQVLLLERHDLGDARVGHGDVEAAMAVERVLDEPIQVSVVAHVAAPRRWRPSPRPGARAPARRARRRSTSAPAARRTRTKRSPRPREAPVTIATRPSRRKRPSISGAGIGAGYIVAAVALPAGLSLNAAPGVGGNGSRLLRGEQRARARRRRSLAPRRLPRAALAGRCGRRVGLLRGQLPRPAAAWRGRSRRGRSWMPGPTLAVEGWFEGAEPWLTSADGLRGSLARPRRRRASRRSSR